MPHYIRPRSPGASVFFTVALAQRGDDLLVRQVHHLRTAFAQTQACYPFRIDAFVVLPDHLHCILTLPPHDAGFSLRWGAIKARFTRSVKAGGVNPTLRSVSKRSKGDAGIWQRRFWDHHIRDQADFTNHLHYCWNNPVKHGLVRRASDWPLSSIQREIRQGRICPDWSAPAVPAVSAASHDFCADIADP